MTVLKLDKADEQFASPESKPRGPDLLEAVGTRALKLRKQRRLSRRELSQRSDISMRYLAQLESGEGNISLALLGKLACALEVPLLAFLTDDWKDDQQLADFLAAFERADVSRRRQAIEFLKCAPDSSQKEQRVCLLGLRGAGKSTLGKLVARDFGVPFLELNCEIEAAAGMPLGEIIAFYGQDGFRKLEAETLQGLVETQSRAVIAVAGGIVDDAAGFEHLLKSCHTVWVKASPVEHMERVMKQGDLRPMAGNPEAMAQLRGILTAREDSYRRSDHELDTSGKSVDVSLAELQELLVDAGILTTTAS